MIEIKKVLAAGLILATLLIAVVGFCESYTSPTGTITAGTNYFSLPALPSSIVPTEVFAGIPIDGKLAYWCRMTQEWHYAPVDMTEVSWHMAFRYDSDGDYQLQFEGTQPDVEKSTCLNPTVAGIAFISMPFDHSLKWSDFKFTSDEFPGEKYSTEEAVVKGWIANYLIEGAPDSGVHITLDGAGGTSQLCRSWKGYWITTLIPASEGKLMIYWPMDVANCTYTIDSNAETYDASSDSGSVNVTAAYSCHWAASSDANWIHITAGSSGSGNGTVEYSVDANPSEEKRTGTMTIAGETFTVTQGGATADGDDGGGGGGCFMNTVMQ